jgi:NAD(P)-dependent dehydrogenase (short-subunit alcohol dehydrogenase family)
VINVLRRALAIEAEVTDRDALVAAARRVQDELGGADVLVNNAGVMLLGPFTSDQRAPSSARWSRSTCWAP